ILESVIEDDDPGSDAVGSELDPNDIDAETIQRQLRRNFTRANPYVQYRISERLTVEAQYDFLDQSFDEDVAVGLVESERNGGSLGLSHRLSERDDLRFQVGFSHFEPKDRLQSDIYEATATWQRRVSRRTNFVAEVGYREVSNDSVDDSGVLVRLRTRRKSVAGTFGAEVQRLVIPTAFGNLQETDRLSLSYQRGFFSRANLVVQGRFFDSTTVGGRLRDRRFAQLFAEFSWKLNREFEVGSQLRSIWLEFKGTGEEADGNVFSVFVRYSPAIR
ncbi:MAG: hypothetical protein AAGI88_10475, partial [Pseudomonadota bacterium]